MLSSAILMTGISCFCFIGAFYYYDQRTNVEANNYKMIEINKPFQLYIFDERILGKRELSLFTADGEKWTIYIHLCETLVWIIIYLAFTDFWNLHRDLWFYMIVGIFLLNSIVYSLYYSYVRKHIEKILERINPSICESDIEKHCKKMNRSFCKRNITYNFKVEKNIKLFTEIDTYFFFQGKTFNRDNALKAAEKITFRYCEKPVVILYEIRRENIA